MKAYITKYALSRGIIDIIAVPIPGQPNAIHDNGFFTAYYSRPDWHYRKEDAILHAERMRHNKIASLKKQIEKLEKLRFE